MYFINTAKGFITADGGYTHDVRLALPFASWKAADATAQSRGFKCWAILTSIVYDAHQ